ncbi:tetratricopeptide repeat protein [Aequorivita sinensis]|uniref:tetratricopeptide repeat protein n=1 Tax=Aequorivita sinensis TaxID=1382458 RepID=UPI001121FCF8|nr:tetratricopeptide repeat protein [Aequorivita sinensis]
MNKILTFLFLTFICSNSFGQNASELNEQAKKFIETQEFDKAVPVLKQAAELGVAEAQYNYGVTLEFGYGIEKNIDEAFFWYLKSAEQGWNDGLYKMMMAHANGIGATQSNEKAFEYALQCAENDDITCMFNIVGAYQDGLGTEKDLNKMIEWAIRIGKLKNPENLMKSGKITSARLNLAYMYRDGQNVEMDLSKSYSWFLIYNEFKRDFSILQQQSVIREIKELEQKLTAEQIKNAKRQAEQIFERPLTNLEKLYETSR